MAIALTSPVTGAERPYIRPWNSCQTPKQTSARPTAMTTKPFQVVIGRSSCVLLISRVRSIRCSSTRLGPKRRRRYLNDITTISNAVKAFLKRKRCGWKHEKKADGVAVRLGQVTVYVESRRAAFYATRQRPF